MARFNVLSGSTTTPIAEPGFGQAWLVPGGASGAWESQGGKIAIGNGDDGYIYQAPADGDEIFVVDTDTLYLVAEGGALHQIWPVLGALTVVIGNGSDVIATGVAGDLLVPMACTVTGWTILSGTSGSIVVDVWRDSYANYPPTDADSIAGSELPTLSSATKNQDLALSTWNSSGALAAGDILRFSVDSATTVTQVTLVLHTRR